MAKNKSPAFYEAGSWYHRIKVLQEDGTTKYSKKGGFATAKDAEESYKSYEKQYPEAYRETLVVLDATTGQNALSQAKEFSDVADITGIILTKMDGTAKGGIAVAIQAELGIPVKYIGVGETIDDLQKFDSDEFVQALFTTEEKKEEGEE